MRHTWICSTSSSMLFVAVISWSPRRSGQSIDFHGCTLFLVNLLFRHILCCYCTCVQYKIVLSVHCDNKKKLCSQWFCDGIVQIVANSSNHTLRTQDCIINAKKLFQLTIQYTQYRWWTERASTSGEHQF